MFGTDLFTWLKCFSIQIAKILSPIGSEFLKHDPGPDLCLRGKRPKKESFSAFQKIFPNICNLSLRINMVLIQDGSSEYDAHVLREIGNSICLRNLCLQRQRRHI